MVSMRKEPEVGRSEAFGDVERLLGYRDAIDTATGTSRVGSELLVVPCWTRDFCRVVIRAAEAVGAFEPHPNDPVPGHEVSLAAISPRLFESFAEDFGSRIWPQLRSHWPLIEYHGLSDAFVIKYEPSGQDRLEEHHDLAQVSASIKLNDDYEGGELEFPRQGVTNSDVPIGSLLVWPSLVTHPHRSRRITSGVKYSLTVWCELPLV